MTKLEQAKARFAAAGARTREAAWDGAIAAQEVQIAGIEAELKAAREHLARLCRIRAGELKPADALREIA